jgi:ribosomal protein L11 methyltransferase
MDHRQYLFDNVSTEQKHILIALLSEAGFDGFEEMDTSLKAFTAREPEPAVMDELVKLTGVKYTISTIPETNWNEKWESDFEPVTVFYPDTSTIFANIRAHFHPSLPIADYEVVITPKMSFGTGHHATTYGMIEAMSAIDFTNKQVIDFGTGTGVLAILAQKMGAARVTAIDNDQWSIDNAAENIKINNSTQIELIKADRFVSGNKADIILANINLNVITANLPLLADACKPDTLILLSGMLYANEPAITAALYENSIHIKSVHKKDNWLVIVATRGAY